MVILGEAVRTEGSVERKTQLGQMVPSVILGERQSWGRWFHWLHWVKDTVGADGSIGYIG